jgi:hypothetical protein
VYLGGKDDRSIAGVESRTDKVTQRIEKRIALLIEVNNMLALKGTVGSRLER